MAVKGKPDWSLPYLQLAELHRTNNEFKAAEEIAREGLAADEEEPRLHETLGRVLEAVGKHPA